MSEHAGDVVAPRVSVDCAAGFIVAVLLGPGVKEVADLPRRVTRLWRWPSAVPMRVRPSDVQWTTAVLIGAAHMTVGAVPKETK